ncbi:MAG: hypothetical protein ACE37E_17605, partial [Hyphomicrobiales bacterium]
KNKPTNSPNSWRRVGSQIRSFNRTVLEHFDEINCVRVYPNTEPNQLDMPAGLLARWYLVHAIEAGYMSGYPQSNDLTILMGNDACHSTTRVGEHCGIAIGSALKTDEIWLISKRPVSDEAIRHYANVDWDLKGVVGGKWQHISPSTPMSAIDRLPLFAPVDDGGWIKCDRRKFIF